MIRGLFFLILLAACVYLSLFTFPTACARPEEQSWSLAALPSSVRLDPSSGRILDDGSRVYRTEPLGDLLAKNWIYDGREVSLHAARGEYVSFQLVVRNNTDTTLKDIVVEMKPFAQSGRNLAASPSYFSNGQWR